MSQFFKKNGSYSLEKLLRYYARLLSTVIMAFVLLVAIYTVVSTIHTYQDGMDNSLVKVEDQVSKNSAEVKELGQSLVSTPERRENIKKYFELNPAKYLAYSQKNSNPNTYFYLPDQVYNIFSQNEDIKQVIISENNEQQTLIANKKQRYGFKTYKIPQNKHKFSFYYSFIDSATFGSYGDLYAAYDTSHIKKFLSKMSNTKYLQLYVLNDADNKTFSFYGSKVSAKERIQSARKVNRIAKSTAVQFLKLSKSYDYKVLDTGNKYKIVALISKKSLIVSAVLKMVWFILLGLLIILILLIGMNFTFKNYQMQLKEIIQAMKKVGRVNLKNKVPVPVQDGELKTLAIGINQMLDKINEYVYQIYELQIEQKDANMKALQSQINPHFLYNTLEYIRMYAISENETELAKVVYAFASLLRNNTDQSKMTTLKNELKFIEKYVYLYQMRFPDKIAYGIQIDSDLEMLNIPKFTLQPLVENYFAHGIDFSRADNVISIKAKDRGEFVDLIVQDNGRGISCEKLNQLQTEIDKLKKSDGKRIGLLNVSERMRGVFGKDFEMKLINNEYHGLTVIMTFRRQKNV